MYVCSQDGGHNCPYVISHIGTPNPGSLDLFKLVHVGTLAPAHPQYFGLHVAHCEAFFDITLIHSKYTFISSKMLKIDIFSNCKKKSNSA